MIDSEKKLCQWWTYMKKAILDSIEHQLQYKSDQLCQIVKFNSHTLSGDIVASKGTMHSIFK